MNAPHFLCILVVSIISDPKGNFICNNTPRKTILSFFGCSEVNSAWLITSDQAKQRAPKVLFTCAVYTYKGNDTYTVTLPSISPAAITSLFGWKLKSNT